MESFTNILLTLDGLLGSSPWFPYVLLGTGLFFTIYLKFPQVRYFKHATQVVRGKFDKEGDPGDTSHFQALATALSGTVGTGNISGVALAIFIGGPAAVFWMWATAFFGMTTKFCGSNLVAQIPRKNRRWHYGWWAYVLHGPSFEYEMACCRIRDCNGIKFFWYR